MKMPTHVSIIMLALRIANAIIDPHACFTGDITSHYTGDSMNIATSQWEDITGNGNHAVVAGTGIEVFDGVDSLNELYSNGNKVVAGTTSTQITFNPSLPADRTLIHLCKYRDVGTARRIIQAESYNFISGFHDGRSGVAFDSYWMTAKVQRFKRRWVLSSQTPKLYRANGIDYTATERTGAASKLTINRGKVGTQTSAFACSEIILIDQRLDETQIKCIEGYFAEKYALKATNNIGAHNCLSSESLEDLAGWYDGASYDQTNNVWKDKSGLGYLNNVIIEGTGFGYLLETVNTNELYLNDKTILYGTTATNVIFPAILQPDHTVFSVCKYRETGYKRRIIQAEDWWGIFGFHNGHSGVAKENNGWITNSALDRFGTEWVLSTQTNELYKANMIDFTQGTGGNVGITRLMINKGYVGTQTSDFACAEVIIVNQVLPNEEIQCIEEYLNTKYNIALPTANPGNCLQHPLNLAGWYDGDSFDKVNNVWNDKSGARYPGIISGTGIALSDGVDVLDEFYINNAKVVSGTTATKVKFDRWLAPDNTIFNLCKYKEVGTKMRILQAETYNGLWGFVHGRSGNAYAQTGYISNQVDNFGTNWVLSSQTPELYRGNFIDFTVTPRTVTSTTRLMINSGWSATATSDFACAEIIMINEILSQDEIICIENYFDTKYALRPKENPGQCLTAENQPKLRGWYDGDSFDSINNIWKDKSGYGYNNYGVITGTGIELFDGTDVSNEFYQIGKKIVTGTIYTKIKFNPVLQAQHTVINICKYKSGGTRRRILQAEKYNAIHGFTDRRSGLCYENKYLCAKPAVEERFGNEYVTSANTLHECRANGVSYWNGVVGTAKPSRVAINTGIYGSYSSHFGCSDIILVDAELSSQEIECIENCINLQCINNPTKSPTTNPTTKDPTSIPTTNNPTKDPTPSPTCTETAMVMNILFVIDESGSVNNGAGNENNYALSIDFVINLIENSINIESRVAAMSFASVNQKLHGFDDQQDGRTDIVNALLAEKNDYASLWTYTYNALTGAANEFISNSIPSIDRNIVFLITDGIPDCPVDPVDPDCRTDVCSDALSNMLKSAGIDLYIIGVTDKFDRTKLDCLVDETLQQKIFLLPDFTQQAFKALEGDVREGVLCQDVPLARSIDKNMQSLVNNRNNNNNKELNLILVYIFTCILTICILSGAFYAFYRYKLLKSKTVKYENVENDKKDEMQLFV